MTQAHHKIPGEDSSLVALCAECHSKKHPDLPKSLFFKSKSLQPYWHNKSASSLAKELGIHPRTVIRAARRLEISPGELSPWDEELIRNNIPKLQWNSKAKTTHFPKTCERCGYSWQARKLHPLYCPRCSTVLEILPIPGTIQSYLKTGKRFLTWVSSDKEPTATDFCCYFIYRREQDISERTLRKEVFHLRELALANSWEWPFTALDVPRENQQ